MIEKSLICRYMFPRILFTHHLWNEEQKIEFGQHFHTHRLSHYHNVLEHVDKQTVRHTHGQTQEQLKIILNKVNNFVFNNIFVLSKIICSLLKRGILTCDRRASVAKWLEPLT